MTNGNKDIPIKTSFSDIGFVNIPISVSLLGSGTKDIPIQATFQGSGSKDIPIQTSFQPYRVDYGLYGVSEYKTVPRHTIFFAQADTTPDKTIAANDPYWYIKSATAAANNDGFMEIGIGQNSTYDQTDANLTSFVRVAEDANEGWVKIKPSLWFHPESQPTTAQDGMMYYDSTAHEFKYYDGDAGTWRLFSAGTTGDVHGSGTSGYLAKWTAGDTIGDSIIQDDGSTVSIGGNLSMDGNEIQFTSTIFHSTGTEMHMHPATGDNPITLLLHPIGTEDQSTFRLQNAASLANTGYVTLDINGTAVSLNAGADGTGTSPNTFNINSADWNTINIGDSGSSTIIGGTLTLNNVIENGSGSLLFDTNNAFRIRDLGDSNAVLFDLATNGRTLEIGNTSDRIDTTITGDIVPSSSTNYNLGSDTYWFKDIYTENLVHPYLIQQPISAWGTETLWHPLNDCLSFADQKWTVSDDQTPVSGSLAHPFDRSMETSVRYTTFPVVITIDFNPSQYHYWRVIGCYFVYNRSPQNLKIEVYNGNTLSWATILDTTTNTDDTVFWTGEYSYVEQIRITASGANDASGEIAFASIFGMSGHSGIIPSSGYFLAKDGGDAMRGDLDIYRGYDLRGYSDEGSTQTFYVDTATGNAQFDGTITTGGSISAQYGSVGNLNADSDIGQVMEYGDTTNTTLRFDSDNWRLWAGGASGIGQVIGATETGNVSTYGSLTVSNDFVVDTAGYISEYGATSTYTDGYALIWDTSNTRLQIEQYDYSNLANVPSSFTPSVHDLTGTAHTETGLTAGHFLKADSTTTFSWQAHGLSASDVGAAPTPHTMTGSDHSASGLTVGHVIRASGTSTFAWAQLQHGDLGSVGTTDHQDLASVGGAPLTLSGQQITFNYDTNHFQLNVNDLQIGTDTPGTDEVLTWNGSKAVWAAGGTGGVSGSGTQYAIPYWDTTSSISDSIITQNTATSTADTVTIAGEKLILGDGAAAYTYVRHYNAQGSCYMGLANATNDHVSGSVAGDFVISNRTGASIILTADSAYVQRHIEIDEDGDITMDINNYLDIRPATDSYGILVRDSGTTSYYANLKNVNGVTYIGDSTGTTASMVAINGTTISQATWQGNVIDSAYLDSSFSCSTVVASGEITMSSGVVGSPYDTNPAAGSLNVGGAVRVGSDANYIYIGGGTINRGGTATLTLGENTSISGNLSISGDITPSDGSMTIGDYNDDIYIGDFIGPDADNTGYCGSAANRWGDVYGVTIHTGDILLDNGMTITETVDEDDQVIKTREDGKMPGVALLSTEGKEILRVDDDGTLHLPKDVKFDL